MHLCWLKRDDFEEIVKTILNITQGLLYAWLLKTIELPRDSFAHVVNWQREIWN